MAGHSHPKGGALLAWHYKQTLDMSDIVLENWQAAN
jgi:hypothetical protein